MSQIKISHLTFSYDSNFENIFTDVCLELDTDWRLGLIGRNGRGKTTFLKLLLGKMSYSGAITTGVSFDYFPFQVEEKAEVTGKVMQKIAPQAGKWQLEKELNLLGVRGDVLERSFSTLSQGEQTKVLLAALFLKEHNFLLIDEPTNHLDNAARSSVGSYLKSKRGFILVSHDRMLLDAVTDHILCINKTDIEIQKGNFSSWQENKKRQDEYESAKNERLKGDIERLKAARERTASWSERIEKTKNGRPAKGASGIKPDKGYIGHQSAKMMKHAKSIEERQENAIAEKSTLLKNLEYAPRLELKTLAPPRQRLMEVSNLSIFYGDKEAVKGVSFYLERGERLALCGPNGSGKSSIIRLLMGGDIVYSGCLAGTGNLIVSYIPQDTSFLRGSLRDFALREEIEESLFKSILRQLDFSRPQFEKDISEYSEGQKKKLLLAKSIAERAHLYIWDEPLNYIDVLSRVQVEEMILRYCPTMIFVEHDQLFNQNIATKNILL